VEKFLWICCLWIHCCLGTAYLILQGADAACQRSQEQRMISIHLFYSSWYLQTNKGE